MISTTSLPGWGVNLACRGQPLFARFLRCLSNRHCAALSRLPSACRSEKLVRLNFERHRKPFQNIDARCIEPALDCTDIGSIDFRAMRKLLLRPATGSSQFPEVQRQHISQVHLRDDAALSSISPRSILYKMRWDGRLRPCSHSGKIPVKCQ